MWVCSISVIPLSSLSSLKASLLFPHRVLEALTRKFVLDKYVSLPTLAKRSPINFTGADLYALCADAWFQAAKRKVNLPFLTYL